MTDGRFRLLVIMASFAAFFLVLAFMLASCASPSGYQPPGKDLWIGVKHEEAQRKKP